MYHTKIWFWACTLLSEPQRISTASFSFSLEKRLVLTIEPEDYITKTGTGGSIKLYVKGKVQETGQSFATQDVVELMKPALNVTVSYLDNINKLHLVMVIY